MVSNKFKKRLRTVAMKICRPPPPPPVVPVPPPECQCILYPTYMVTGPSEEEDFNFTPKRDQRPDEEELDPEYTCTGGNIGGDDPLYNGEQGSVHWYTPSDPGDYQITVTCTWQDDFECQHTAIGVVENDNDG
jgi:hypothetical protein